MSDIEIALKELSAVHAKYNLSGRFFASDDVSVRWPAELPHSTELDVFYNGYEPDGVKIETGLTPLKLFDMVALRQAQIGVVMRRWRGLIKLNTTQHLGSGTVESYSGTVAKLKLDNENARGK